MASSSSRIFLFATLLLLSASSSLATDSSKVVATDSKVSVELYYESLCPYCADFIVNYLSEIFHNGVISIVKLDLIPYGNAHVGSDGNITCQHGELECALNVREACAIKVWPDINVHFAFIKCIEDEIMHETPEYTYTHEGQRDCFQINETRNLDPKPVLQCHYNGTGDQLHREHGRRTDALNPPKTGVPWIVIDGKHLEYVYDEFQVAVCKAYKGKNRPKVCDEPEHLLKISEEKKLRNRVGMSSHNKISLPDHAMKKETVE